MPGLREKTVTDWVFFDVFIDYYGSFEGLIKRGYGGSSLGAQKLVVERYYPA